MLIKIHKTNINQPKQYNFLIVKCFHECMQINLVIRNNKNHCQLGFNLSLKMLKIFQFYFTNGQFIKQSIICRHFSGQLNHAKKLALNIPAAAVQSTHSQPQQGVGCEPIRTVIKYWAIKYLRIFPEFIICQSPRELSPEQSLEYFQIMKA